MARYMNPGVGERYTQATVLSTAASTGTVLVSSTLTASTGRNLKIKGASVYITADTAMTVSMHDSSTGSSTDTLVWRQYVAANGGMVHSAPRGEYLFQCTTGNEVTLVTGAGNMFVSVLYEVAT